MILKNDSERVVFLPLSVGESTLFGFPGELLYSYLHGFGCAELCESLSHLRREASANWLQEFVQEGMSSTHRCIIAEPGTGGALCNTKSQDLVIPARKSRRQGCYVPFTQFESSAHHVMTFLSNTVITSARYLSDQPVCA